MKSAHVTSQSQCCHWSRWEFHRHTRFVKPSVCPSIHLANLFDIPLSLHVHVWCLKRRHGYKNHDGSNLTNQQYYCVNQNPTMQIWHVCLTRCSLSPKLNISLQGVGKPPDPFCYDIFINLCCRQSETNVIHFIQVIQMLQTDIPCHNANWAIQAFFTDNESRL